MVDKQGARRWKTGGRRTAAKRAAADASEPAVPGPVVIELFGQKWELPTRLPAEFLIVGAELTAGKDWRTDLSYEDSLTLMSLLVPKPMLDAWFDAGLDADQFGEVMVTVLERYGYRGARGTIA